MMEHVATFFGQTFTSCPLTHDARRSNDGSTPMLALVLQTRRGTCLAAHALFLVQTGYS